MSELVLEQKGLKPNVQALAVQLREKRAAETDKLQQRVADRGEPVAAEAKHDHGGGEDGIATPTQMYALEEATGAAAQAQYVEMMTKHHRGAGVAAHEEIAHGQSPALLEFAQMVLRTREEQLTVLLGARDASAEERGASAHPPCRSARIPPWGSALAWRHQDDGAEVRRENWPESCHTRPPFPDASSLPPASAARCEPGGGDAEHRRDAPTVPRP